MSSRLELAVIRRAAKVDDNQERIVSVLRSVGVVVRVLSAVGQGFPDLLTLYGGVLRLVEIKNPAARGKLTNVQKKMLEVWPVFVVNDEREALAAHGIEVAA